MSAVPETAKEAKSLRAIKKRKVNSLLKQAKPLLDSSDGIPHHEFSKLADELRHQLDLVQIDNDYVIRFKCKALDSSRMDDAAIEAAEEKIAETEENYVSQMIDLMNPTVHQLIKKAEECRPPEPKPAGPDPTVSKAAATARSCMEKLKFPTFYGDMRDYNRFKEIFEHFSRHLTKTEILYQLVQSMERPDEKKTSLSASDSQCGL